MPTQQTFLDFDEDDLEETSFEIDSRVAFLKAKVDAMMQTKDPDKKVLEQYLSPIVEQYGRTEGEDAKYIVYLGLIRFDERNGKNNQEELLSILEKFRFHPGITLKLCLNAYHMRACLSGRNKKMDALKRDCQRIVKLITLNPHAPTEIVRHLNFAYALLHVCAEDQGRSVDAAYYQSKCYEWINCDQLATLTPDFEEDLEFKPLPLGIDDKLIPNPGSAASVSDSGMFFIDVPMISLKDQKILAEKNPELDICRVVNTESGRFTLRLVFKNIQDFFYGTIFTCLGHDMKEFATGIISCKSSGAFLISCSLPTLPQLGIPSPTQKILVLQMPYGGAEGALRMILSHYQQLFMKC